ncbi:YHYH protein [Gymnodinialimonas sp. 2305UL16-5]|uniref:YHYH protein n=1 Tax=Gymnodinialimonas mytili TaxID=3126503 RepID=UPI00309A3D31
MAERISPLKIIAYIVMLSAGAAMVISTFGNPADAQDQSDLPLEITNLMLTETDPDCAAYVDCYASSVMDLQQRRNFTGHVLVTAGDAACQLQSNGIPNHDFGDAERNFATPAAEIDHDFSIPRSPRQAETATALSHGRFDGILLNGVVLHILSAGCYDPDGPRVDANGNVQAGCPADHPWLLDPMAENAPFAEDTHNGHTQPDGMYHYHGNPMALFDSAPGPDGSPVIGFAADGFPIYGSYFRDASGTVRQAVSGYELRDGDRPTGNGNPGGTYDGLYRADYVYTGAGDLDECNGMTVDGQYAYYITDSFPWAMACLTGTPDPSFMRR